MKFQRIAATAALFAVAAGAALGAGTSGGEIGPGSPAPKLEIKKWFKGKPIEKLDADKTYVIEFWATWCGPCKTSIPHITELAKKHPDVTFIGVGIWEDDVDDKIASFVEDMGAKMDYKVAYSGNKDGMAVSWMEAAGRNGIPCSFIVKDGTIQWIGHPMSMDKPLEEIKSGSFDLASFKASFDKEAAANRKAMALRAEIASLQKLYDSGKTVEAKAKLDAIVKDNPQTAPQADAIRFGWLAREDRKAWEGKVDSMLASGNASERSMVLSFALREAGPTGNHELGRIAMEKALAGKGSSDMLVLQYANSFYAQLKDYKMQMEMLNRITEILPNSPNKDNKDFIEWLEKTKKEVSEKLKGSGS